MGWFQNLFGGDAGAGTIDGVRARALVAEGALLVDVRSPGEFAGGHLPNARNIPVDALGARIGELNADQVIVVYCRSGARSANAARLLRAEGFGQVHDLGGMGRW